MTDLLTWKKMGFVGLTALACAACSGNGSEPGDPGDFIADNPFSQDGGGEDGGGEGDTAAGTGDPGSDDGMNEGGDGGDGEREIAEADIIQIEGDRLYALSQFGGLTVIDVSTPDVYPVLGRFRANAQPFEMYVDNGHVFVMYSSFGRYEINEDTGYYEWQQSSSLLALDASNAADIQKTGEFSMPGTVQDSRRVGDVLYVATYEDGYCWGCDEGASRTVITSLDVSIEEQVEQVDQLKFDDPVGADGWSWGGPRSVSATDERLYIAGPLYDGDWESDHSVIDVVDISDPGGALVRGTNVEVAGQIESRWQMDEHEGVLRVVSQAGWGGGNPPRIETFSVASASDITPLGSLDMTLPRPESLQSVRFDGERGYAITFEQTDPLFTLDFSDPANPRQVGELEIPGFVYHMEPRGDRILGIGFDNANPAGALNVSLFDVSDFDNPTMLQRVSFGGDWANFAEDQNRIHKAFQILEDENLILVPFSGWDWEDGDGCYGTHQSGIQLVDWKDDSLALRGVAPSVGEARRALLHNGRLLGISDLALQSFDISNRDKPTKTGDLALATNVTGMAIEGDLIVRLSADWWSSNTMLEVADASDPESPTALGRLQLDEVVPSEAGADAECWYYSYYDPEIFVRDGFVYLVRSVWGDDYYESQHLAIDVVDIRDAFAPAYVETLSLPFSRGWSYGPHLTNDQAGIVMVGDALVVSSTQTEWLDDNYSSSVTTGSFEVVDLSDPGHPVHAESFARPDALALGGLQVFDGAVVSWHMLPANAAATKVRFYLDRMYVPSAAKAEVAPPVNVPGAVVAWDESSQRAVVVDHQFEASQLSDEDCWQHPRGRYLWDGDDGSCRLVERDLHLVRVDDAGAYLLDSVALEGEDAAVRGAAASDDRLFVHLQRGSYAWAEDGGFETLPTTEVAVFEAWQGKTLDVTAIAEVPGEQSWLSDLQAAGTRLVFRAGNGLGEVDAADAAAPQVEVHDLYGYYCHDLDTAGDRAYCAMGQFGLQTVELGE